jgi:hypothetical protein
MTRRHNWEVNVAEKYETVGINRKKYGTNASKTWKKIIN